MPRAREAPSLARGADSPCASLALSPPRPRAQLLSAVGVPFVLLLMLLDWAGFRPSRNTPGFEGSFTEHVLAEQGARAKAADDAEEAEALEAQERALRVERINRQLAEQNGDSTGNPRYSAFDPVMPQLEVDRAIAEVLEKRAKRYGTE